MRSSTVSSTHSTSPSTTSLPSLQNQRSLPVRRTAADITNFDLDSDDDVPYSPALTSTSAASIPMICQNTVLTNPVQSLMIASTCPITSVPVSSVVAPPSKKQKKNSVPTSKSDIENELLKCELSTASAKVASIDRELQTYKETCSILTERLKFFEDQQNQLLQEKYFSQIQQSSTQNPPSTLDISPNTSVQPQCLPTSQDNTPTSPAQSTPLSGPASAPSGLPPVPPSSPATFVQDDLPVTCSCNSLLLELQKKVDLMSLKLDQVSDHATSFEPSCKTSQTAADSNTTPSPSQPSPACQSAIPTQSTDPSVTLYSPSLTKATQTQAPKHRVLLGPPPAPSTYCPRPPPVWLPGYTTPQQALYGWQVNQNRSRARTRSRVKSSRRSPVSPCHSAPPTASPSTPPVPVVDLIDLN